MSPTKVFIYKIAAEMLMQTSSFVAFSVLRAVVSGFKTDTSLSTYSCVTHEISLIFRNTLENLYFSLAICVDLLLSKIFKSCKQVLRRKGDVAWRLL